MDFIRNQLTINIDDEQFWHDMREPLISAIQLFVMVGLGMLTMAMFADYINFPDQLAALYASKLGTALLFLSVLALLRTDWGRAHPEALVLLGILGSQFTIAYQSRIVGTIFMITFLSSFGALISATMMPWRLRWHMVAVTFAILSITITRYLLNDAGIEHEVPQAAGGIIVTLISIPIAIYTNGHRYALWKAEMSLRESEERFRQLAENNRDIILTWSPDRKIEYISPAYERFTGSPREELYQNALLVVDKVIEEDRTTFGEALESIISGKFVEMEVRLRHKDGGVFNLEGWGAPIRNKRGEIVRYLGVWHDVTERVGLLKKVSENEERFRQLAENSKDIIWIWSPSRMIEYISPAYETYTGTSPDELYENAILVLDKVHPDDRETFGQAIEAIIGGEFRKMDLRVRHQNGTLFHLEGWGAPIRDWQGQVVRCVGIWRDVSERVQMINDLDAYAHTVAHDLKNPVALVVSYVDLIETLDIDIPESLMPLLEVIMRNAYSMIDIIDALLLLANVRSGKEIDIAPVEMQKLIHNTLDRLKKVIQDFEAEVKHPETWHLARGYAPWIEEIWSNYISNAIKYGGKPPVIELGSDLRNGSVRFWVRDNGRGMTAEDRASVFQEFSRLAQHSKIEGHGLGLSIVQRIAERLGGKVGVESKEGEGSTFYFELPPAES